MSDRFGWWPPPSKPLPVADGLKTRRRQGGIGDSWWSKRFIDVLESFGLENRLARGRAYARKGQVVSLDVQRGTAHAVVQGSRARPYRVVIGVDELSDDDWNSVGEAFASKAVFLAKLLASEMPQNIEEAFAACSLSLFPESLDDLETVCSCPDVANPCKHIAAALYLLAESFDDDPFRIFEWRGRGKDELLSSLRRTHASAVSSPDYDDSGADFDVDELMWGAVDANDSVVDDADFWGSNVDLSALQSSVTASSYADVLLRQLEPFEHQLGDVTLVDVLAPSYSRIAAGAESQSTAERLPDAD
jgi:uncharacterized Zn finger protein